MSRLRDVTSELPVNGTWCMLMGLFLAVLWDILKKMGHLRGSDAHEYHSGSITNEFDEVKAEQLAEAAA